MKKIALFLLALVAFSSCEEDIQFNNPSLQVMKDNELLRVVNPHVVLNLDGSVSLTGSYGFETLILKVASPTPGTYKFGLNNSNVAYYKYEADGLVLEYSTISGVDNSQMEDDLGELVILPPTHPRASKEPGTISGEFKFRGKILNSNPFGSPNIFFHQGVFYGLKVQGVQNDIEP